MWQEDCLTTFCSHLEIVGLNRGSVGVCVFVCWRECASLLPHAKVGGADVLLCAVRMIHIPVMSLACHHAHMNPPGARGLRNSLTSFS